MAEHPNWNEPPIDPLADTNPSLTLQAVPPDAGLAGWRRAAGWLSLLAAAGLTAATALVLLAPAQPPPPALASPAAVEPAAQAAPEIVPTDQPAPTPQPVAAGASVAMLNPEQMAALLTAPLALVADQPAGRLVRDIYDPFTIVPDRPRNEVIQYTAAKGDTIYTIAQRFGLKPETIAWSNSRRIVQVLRPGDVLNIPPVDGVYHQVIGSRTLAQIAASFQVNDPYVVIDSEYNNLFGISPDTVPPSGSWVFIPGGQAEQITWNPGITVEKGEGARAGYVSSFAPGDPGSCGNVQNPGGGAAWGFPLRGGYTFTRGFTSWHTGVDLAAPVGTPVLAANSGAVIFAGWSSWGYGYTVVLAHGPFLTLYAHMSAINVGCGQLVSVGQVIGAVGSTGNSSGPHLHFEIRNGDTPTDPTATMRF